MAAKRVLVGIGLGATIAAGIAVAPALGASGSADLRAAKRPVTLSTRGGIGSFTPASADPRLAAVLARANLAANGFRFTPSDPRSGSRAVTVAVRARSSRTADAEKLASASATTPAVSLTPLAYNLGVAVGWKRFALSSDVTKVDLAGAPGSREAADLALSYSGQRISGRVKAAAERPLVGQPALPGDAQSYSLDLGGSYSLSRNLDVTAGVRYRSDRERLQPVEDNRRDSQAVYIGTAFRF